MNRAYGPINLEHIQDQDVRRYRDLTFDFNEGLGPYQMLCHIGAIKLGNNDSLKDTALFS